MQSLITMIVGIKKEDTAKFQRIITAMIQILSEENVAPETKLKSMIILRKLSNYKANPVIS